MDDAIDIRTAPPDSHYRLRSCAVCGGEAVYTLRQAGGKRFWQCECQECGHKGAKAESRHGAQILWNQETLEAGA